MLNLHHVFYKFLENKCFLAKLNVSDSEKETLREAKKIIRNHLRNGIAALTEQQLGKEKRVYPRFRVQGSWIYRTLNTPAHCPPQQIDLDDGVYLPMSLMNGTAPSIACEIFFNIVDGLLEKLAKDHGWRLVKKETCTRVIISETAHIDVPLYAIPDSEFVSLTEAAALRGYTIEYALRKADEHPWIWIASDRVWLAIRGGQWHQSDPRKVQEWFERLKAIYGDQFVRVCRYLKAWRDFHWQKGGPCSILLMVCVSLEFKKYTDRDDLALLNVVSKLADHLAGDLYNAEIDSQVNNLNVVERQEATMKARNLASVFRQAIENTSDSETAIRLLTNQFGSRIPNVVDLIKTPVQEVQSTPKQVVAAPAIQRVRAG